FWQRPIGCYRCLRLRSGSAFFLFDSSWYCSMNHAHVSAFPIDSVYLWCDGSDPTLREKRIRYMAEAQQAKLLEEEAVAKGRFEDNSELKYALRSLEKFAPFIRTVFLVTDGQHPEWLNLSHPRLQQIDHSEIIPQKYLPTFNSNVIEAFVHKIPGLSEHFLLANDDLLFAAAVGPDFFFDGDGKPVVFGMRSKMKDLPRMISVEDSVFEGQFEYNLYYSNLQLYLKTGRFHAFGVHHNIDAYRKSSIEKVVELFESEYEDLYPCRFRERGRVTRFLPLFYDAAHNRATVRIVNRFSKTRDR